MRHHRLRIEHPRRRPLRPAPLVVAACLAVGFVSSPASARAAADPVPPAPSTPAPSPAPTSVASGRLVLAHRFLAQDQGDWQVDYGFRNAGSEPVVLLPRDMAARVEGWLSNSRVAAHANPRHAACAVDGQSAAVAYAVVIAAPDEGARCRERVALWVGTGASGVPAPGTKGAGRQEVAASLGSFGAPAARHQPAMLAPVTVEPGALVLVRVRLEHDHIVHGAYDPLLGRRDLELRLGGLTFRDALPLDREQYFAQPRGAWPEPPADRRDARHSVTGPDSLHLDADEIGGNYFQFPERPVRYSSRMRLRFWYRVAPGSQGELTAKVRQYGGPQQSYKSLADGSVDIPLTTAGRWVRFDQIIRTEADATTLGLAFHITSADIGEAWVDDVTLEPVDVAADGP